MRSVFGRHHDTVGNEVIETGQSQRARKNLVVDLHGRRTTHEDAWSRDAGEAIQVDQQINLSRTDLRGGGIVAEPSDINDRIERTIDALAHCTAVVATLVEGDEFKAAFVMKLEQFDHQKTGGMMTKLAGDVADANASALLRTRHPRW